MSKNHLLFVFVDGIGLGEDAAAQPLCHCRHPCLRRPPWRVTDGSTSYLYGCRRALWQTRCPLGGNGLTAIGYWTNQFTHRKKRCCAHGQALRTLSGAYGQRTTGERRTLFHDLPHSVLANVYPPKFTERARLNAVVYAAVQAGVTLRNFDDYQQGRAISADLTGDYLAKHVGSPAKTPFVMGQQLAKLAQAQPFTMFDFWLSDEAGHRWSLAEAVTLVSRLDTFLAGVLSARDNLTVLLTSDHGNLEDKTRKTHTLADVPLIVVGKGAPAFADAASLTDIAPAVRRYLTQSPETEP